MFIGRLNIKRAVLFIEGGVCVIKRDVLFIEGGVCVIMHLSQ